MTREEVARLAALADTWGCSPREVLVAAALGVDAPARKPGMPLRALPAEGVDACARLLLTPPGSYATDELETLLASIWRTGDR